MNFGLFLMPSHPPERSLYDATQWDLDMIQWADEMGYSEVWIGEHFTAPWETIPSPDLLIAQALMRTKRIKVAPGAHLLPYHHPIELAHRIAYLDHLAQGRMMLGVGAGGLLSDAKLFNVDAETGENRKMMAESLEIMLKLWTEKELLSIVEITGMSIKSLQLETVYFSIMFIRIRSHILRSELQDLVQIRIR